jgi:glycine betaine/proline transport system substrate-binding protein
VDTLKPGEDVMWIEVPEVNLPDAMKDLEDAATVEGVEGCVNDPCKLGFPANDIRPVANSEFLDENPAVRALLETASIPITDIFSQNAKMNNGEGDPEDVARHASEWIEAHADLVDGWLEKARAAAN